MRGALPIVALAAIAACGYEHVPRSGPLATVADSLVPGPVVRDCQRDKLPPTGAPSYRTCSVPGAMPRLISITRSGRVLQIVINWPDDSAGVAAAASVSQQFSVASGVPPARGEADATAEEYHWRTDSVCYSLYRAFDHAGYQAAWTLPEWFGTAFHGGCI